ncbi:MAG TPA: chromate transporter [Caulobacteraceae bacterium]|nr:chromate transporter [Caulobacteraceae bacterium]
MSSEAPSTPPAPTHAQLFVQFMWASVRGFGGVFVMGRRMLVEETRWLTPQEFVDTLGLCQFLPGANIVNMSVAVGARYRGWTGSLAALSGILTAPCLIAVGLTALYERYAVLPVVARSVHGVAAAAAGLVIGASLKSAAPVLARDKAVAVAIILLVLAAAGLLHVPLLAVLFVGAPLSIALAWARQRRAGAAA